MAPKTAALPRHEIPLQKDGRTELQELAAALSLQVEHRHRTRGAHELEPVATEPTRYNLTHFIDAAAAPASPASPRPTQSATKRVRRAVPIVVAIALTAGISVAGWTSAHPGTAHPGAAKPGAAHTAPAPQPAAAPAQVNPTPTTPAEWGAAAHQRLSQAGHPVDVFGCQGAYAADATSANGALPPATTQPAIWQAYLSACLSGMSDTRIGRSG